MIPLINAFMATSAYIIVSMTVNRFIGIYKPLLFRRIHTFKNARLCVCFSFILSFSLHLPVCFQNKVFMNSSCSSMNNTSNNSQALDVDENVDDCGWQSTQNLDVVDLYAFKAYLVVVQILIRVAPTVLLTILNILVVHKYRTIAAERTSATAGMSARPVSTVDDGQNRSSKFTHPN